MTEGPTAPPAKVDPETLAIRAEPIRAIRFKRGLIIVIAALGAISVAVVTWHALQPRLFQHPATDQDMSEPNMRPTADAVSGTPATYQDVPRLGPPLPGDLGGAILHHQQVELASMSTGDTQRESTLAEARQREVAEIKAARESGLLVSARQGSSAAENIGVASPSPVSGVPAEASKPAIETAGDPNLQGRKAEFVSALDPKGDINPHRVAPAPSPYVLSAGSVIAASLITGIRSDLPGLVTAQVTENVYDSPTGRLLLIPQGARLIGSYDSIVAFGQTRALIVWQRIVMSDGRSLRIDNVPAADPSGYAGMADQVDRHTWQLLKGAALSTLLGVGSELALSGQSDLVQALRLSTQDSVSRSGDQLTQHNLGVQPTITIRPGAPVRLVVHKDLVLAPQA